MALKRGEVDKALQGHHEIGAIFGFVNPHEEGHGRTIEFGHLLSSLGNEVVHRFLREKFRHIEITGTFQMALGFLGAAARHEADAGDGIDSEFVTIAGDSLEVNPIGVPLGEDMVELFLAVQRLAKTAEGGLEVFEAGVGIAPRPEGSIN
jgi:hypothetical protein